MPDELSADFVRQEQHKRELTELIENRIGKAITIEVRQIEEGRRFEESFVDIEQVVHMDIIKRIYGNCRGRRRRGDCIRDKSGYESKITGRSS